MTILFASLASCSVFKGSIGTGRLFGSKKVVTQADTAKESTVDTVKNKVKSFKEVITDKAVTDSGVLIVHRIDDKYYFEVPNAVLDRDLLVTSRIARAATGNRPSQGNLGYAGDPINNNVLRFEKGPGDRIVLRQVSYKERSTDSTANGMWRAVQASTLQPIAKMFDIKAYNADSTSIVVEVTDLITDDNTLFFFGSTLKGTYNLGGFKKEESYPVSIQSFPTNVEIRTVKTFAKEHVRYTYELNTSIVLLPLETMVPRHADERIGYFIAGYVDFDEPQGGARPVQVINRWRLEPKSEDRERYLAGELVEPSKPIVFYIDPATPKKWVSYLIQGVNDWKGAFEKAGFKNAIYALEAPDDNPEWSLYDARHSAIVYMPSTVPNAMGPHIHDPRSGEILESHIHWYHNVMELLRDWYLVQVGPNDPRARTMQFSDELMGELIRFVCSHEVGHALGLMHNFGASATVPVDSLRSRSYLEKYGHCPSIMDYARFNYVAQPEDSIPPHLLMPRIGLYDEWAIEWGYRWLPQLETREQERVYMDNWIKARLAGEPRLWYGEQQWVVIDPRNQSEDLGDDAMEAGRLGIENLKRVMTGLRSWTLQPHENYGSFDRMRQQTLSQYARYVMHVAKNIGLVTHTKKTVGQPGAVVGHVPRAKQRRAVKFLHEQVFDIPYWIMDSEVFAFVAGHGPFTPAIVQQSTIFELMNQEVYHGLVFGNELAPKSERYRFDKLLNDLAVGIWKELASKSPVDFQRRILQRLYMEHLVKMLHVSDPSKMVYGYLIIVQDHVRKLLRDVETALPLYRDKETANHLRLVRDRLKWALHEDRWPSAIATPAITNSASGPGLQISWPIMNNERTGKYQGVGEPVVATDQLIHHGLLPDRNYRNCCPAHTTNRVVPRSCWYDPNYEKWINEQFEILNLQQ